MPLKKKYTYTYSDFGASICYKLLYNFAHVKFVNLCHESFIKANHVSLFKSIMNMCIFTLPSPYYSLFSQLSELRVFMQMNFECTQKLNSPARSPTKSLEIYLMLHIRKRLKHFNKYVNIKNARVKINPKKGSNNNPNSPITLEISANISQRACECGSIKWQSCMWNSLWLEMNAVIKCV